MNCAHEIPKCVRVWADGQQVETIGLSSDFRSAFYRRRDGLNAIRDIMPTADHMQMDTVVLDNAGGHVVCSPAQFDETKVLPGNAVDSSTYLKLLSVTLESPHAAAEARNVSRVEKLLDSRALQNLAFRVNNETFIDVARRSMSEGEFEIVRAALTRRIVGELFQGITDQDFNSRIKPVYSSAFLNKKARIGESFAMSSMHRSLQSFHTVGTMAVLRKNNAALQAFLEAGGNPRDKMPTGLTISEMVAAQGNAEGLKLLSENGIKFKSSERAYLKAALENPELSLFDAEKLAEFTKVNQHDPRQYKI